MPVNAQLLSKSVEASLRGFQVGFSGKNLSNLSTAIGNVVGRVVTTPNAVTCYFNGTAGPTGTLMHIQVAGVVSTVMSAGMLTKAQNKVSVGFSGRDMGKLFDGISTGLCDVLQTMVLTGTVVGCAIGAGTGQFLPAITNSQAMAGQLMFEMNGQGLKGRDVPKLADCIASGVAKMLKSVVFSVSCAGAIAPTPPTGPVTVAQIPSLTTQVN